MGACANPNNCSSSAEANPNNCSPSAETSAEGTSEELVESKANFRGYGIWVMPKEGSPAEGECVKAVQHFSTRFAPPLILPKWSPHISIAAGITEERVAMDVAEQIAAQAHAFRIDVSGGSEVDGETPETRSTIYFSWQRLRAAWIHCSTGSTVNEFGEDYLGDLCRRARNLLREDTQTSKFVPHLSLVYFDQDELDEKQRSTLKQELQQYFLGKDPLHIESIRVASTEGKPSEWKVLKEFPLQNTGTS